MNLSRRSTDKNSEGRELQHLISTKLRRWCVCTALAAALSACAIVDAQADEPPAPALDAAEAALVKMQAEDWREAAAQTRKALQQTPDDALLEVLGAAVLLHTGDAAASLPFLQSAVAVSPEDSLALYALGLARLSRNERAAALELFDRSERNGGDKTALLIARRYSEWIGGATVAVGGAGLPANLLPAQSALQAMTALRQGDRKLASSQMQTALAALPGDPILQNSGLLMSFDPAHPLTSGAVTLAPGSRPAFPKEAASSGSVALVPEEPSGSVAYVSYSIDGQAQGLVSTRPFSYTWDTRRAANGWHELGVTFFDRDAREMSHTTRRLRVFNPTGGASADSERRERLRVGLWQTLLLRPARREAAYMLGALSRAGGDANSARGWFLRAAALSPSFRDVRSQLAASGGVGLAKSAVFGGLPTEKVIALTFDDGPKPGLTEPLLEMLVNARVPATFFVIGRHVIEFPELTKRLSDAGMEIANHSYTHRSLTALSSEDVAREMLETQAAILTVTGKMPAYMRPPGGNWNSGVAQIVRQWGLTPCMWTVDVYGSEVLGAQQVANAVLNEVRPGSIILMHNGKLSTLQALPTILKELKARGYSFATVETLARRRSAAQEAAANSQSLPHRGE